MRSFTKTTTETFTPRWVALDFHTFNEAFRKARQGMKYAADRCFKCGSKFSPDEKISLGAFKEIGNKVLCGPCAKELMKQEEPNAAV